MEQGSDSCDLHNCDIGPHGPRNKIKINSGFLILTLDKDEAEMPLPKEFNKIHQTCVRHEIVLPTYLSHENVSVLFF